MVLGDAFLIGGIAEILFFLVVSSFIRKEAIWWKGGKHTYSFYALKFFVLPLLSVTLLGALLGELRGGVHLEQMVRWSWLAIVLSTSMVLSRKSVLVTELQKGGAPHVASTDNG